MDFLEQGFGLSLDGGDGSAELIVLLLVVGVLVVISLAVRNALGSHLTYFSPQMARTHLFFRRSHDINLRPLTSEKL